MLARPPPTGALWTREISSIQGNRAHFLDLKNPGVAGLRKKSKDADDPRSSRTPRATPSATPVTSSDVRPEKHDWTRRSVGMQYGVNLPISEDAQTLARLAAEAETAGWDGVFVGDSLSVNLEYEPDKQAIYDPWIALAAIATSTKHVRLGTMVTPLSRRRPWKVARETVTLDHLSQGRLILPVGLGAGGDWGFTKVGEELDRKIRAERLDEGLAILAGLWSGQAFSYEGSHDQVQEMTFVPPPVQQPRIPIWVVGARPRPKSLRRALQWDGILPTSPSSYQQEGSFTEMTPADLQELKTYIEQHRPQGTARYCHRG